MESSTITVTRLLTLLNASASTGKRKRIDDFIPSEKLNKRKVLTETEAANHVSTTVESEETMIVENTPAGADEDAEEHEGADATNSYEAHFGMNPSALTSTAREAVDRNDWNSIRSKHASLGVASVLVPSGSNSSINLQAIEPVVLKRLTLPFTQKQSKMKKGTREFQNSLLSILGTRSDLYYPIANWDIWPLIRESTTLHILDHITRKRRRILKNNERISNAAKFEDSAPPENIQDQGFTRPSVLILLPFRSSALNWFNALSMHTPSPSYQIENHTRFLSEYGLPPGAVDKLATAEPRTYPQDHVEMFKGNVDDSFRVGIKITRKSVKLFSEFYSCDIIIASPLGLRMSIEKEKAADFLSSIEVLVVDQLDALTMQNWEHVEFILSHLNKLPKETHDADFSRIKPWYLDGQSAYLRQSILFSAYETPETRSLFNRLTNVEGKIRIEKRYSPVQIPEGIEQKFLSFECRSSKEEPDKRFEYFTSQVLPPMLKSAVQSTNTVIFIPSSFDFIRVQNHFRKLSGVTFTVLSEYSTNQDISRARQAFFGGKKSFLLISERFHFFRRYKIRGIRNLVFYGPPDHPQFYSEYLSYPFLDGDVDASDISCRVLYSKYDWFKVERIAGTESAHSLIRSS